MTLLPMLFRGAFMMHHATVKQDVIDEIYAKMPKKEELVVKLAELYNEPLETLMDEPDESAENVDWAASW